MDRAYTGGAYVDRARTDRAYVDKDRADETCTDGTYVGGAYSAVGRQRGISLAIGGGSKSLFG